MNGRRVLAGLGPLGLMFGCSAPAPTAHRGSTTTSANPRADAGPDATAAQAATSTGPATSSTAVGSPSATAVDPTTTTVTLTVPATLARSTTTSIAPNTFVLPEKAEDDLTDDEWWATQPGFVSGACGGPLPPCWVMRAESGGDPSAVNATGCGGRGCFGKWQFDPRTSRGLGYALTMDQYPESVQDDAARALWNGGRGCSHWGAC